MWLKDGLKVCGIIWVYYTIPFDFSMFWHIFGHSFPIFETTVLAKDH